MTTEASAELTREIAEKHAVLADLNAKKIALHCNEALRRRELEAEERLSRLTLPQTSAALEEVLSEAVYDALNEYTERVASLLSPEELNRRLADVKTSVNRVTDAARLRNKLALEKMLEACVTSGVEKFKSRLQQSKPEPRPRPVLDRLCNLAQENALQEFSKSCSLAKTEAMYEAHEAKLAQSIRKLRENLFEENVLLIEKFIKKKVEVWAGSMRERLSGLKLPQNTTELELLLAKERAAAVDSFAEDTSDYSGSKAHVAGVLDLQAATEALAAETRRRNVEAYARVLSKPLGNARKHAMLGADKYDTEFSLRRFIHKTCMLELEEGEPKHWPLPIKVDIIDHFMESDDEISRLIKSRDTFWSRFFGFFQWLRWLVTGAG